MAFRYLIGGIVVDSDHPFPTATSSSLNGAGKYEQSTAPDVTISLRKQPMPFSEIVNQDATQCREALDFRFQAKPGLAFHIVGGSRITIYRDETISDCDVTLFLIGSAWGVLCHQRNLLPLHCSAVYAHASAFAFTGPSGIGKSTIAAALCRLGCLHVCDDVGILDEKPDGGVLLRAMPKGLKLWRDATDALGLERCEVVTAEAGIDKFYVNPPAGPDQSTLRLAAVYVMQFGDEGTAPSIERLRGSAHLQSLYKNIYRVEWLNWVRDPAYVFADVGRLAQQLPVFQFTRPRVLSTLDAGLELMEAHMHSQAIVQSDVL